MQVGRSMLAENNTWLAADHPLLPVPVTEDVAQNGRKEGRRTEFLERHRRSGTQRTHAAWGVARLGGVAFHKATSGQHFPPPSPPQWASFGSEAARGQRRIRHNQRFE